MENVTENEKKNLSEKLKEFQKKGLEAYGKYLDDQLVYAAKPDTRKAYKKYVEDQIKMNTDKLNRMK